MTLRRLSPTMACSTVAVLAALVAAIVSGLLPPQALKPATAATTAGSTETPAERDARMKWWRDARFGMFIHWGLYAVPAGEYKRPGETVGKKSTRIGEWIMDWANIPRAEYEKFAAEFNPTKFNAAEYAKLAKDAGMKYIVITSKHHDGFAMYDSKVSGYDIMDATPYKKDLMKELADETRKQGLTFCVYYSILDWHHPTAYVEKEGKDPTAGNRETLLKPGGKEEYVKYMKEQLREVLTQYDPGVLWFDGEWQTWWTQEDGRDLYAYLRSLKPNLIINNRVGRSREGMKGLSKAGEEAVGDFGTPEQQIPPNGLPGVDWESCMTFNDTWGYKHYDQNWKSTETVIRNLIDIVSKGGNYLLNIGPMADGTIPKESVDRLLEVGKWLKLNGDSIYGSTASPFSEPLTFGRATSKPGKVFLHVFNWPTDGKLQTPPLGKTVKKAYLLANPQQVEVAQNDKGLTLTVPKQAPDAIASVIALEVE